MADDPLTTGLSILRIKDDTSPSSSSRSTLAIPESAPPSNVPTRSKFLDIPYTVREMIYRDILSWVGLELFLHTDSTYHCKNPRSGNQTGLARLCIARRTDPEAGEYVEELPTFRKLDEYISEYEIDNFCEKARHMIPDAIINGNHDGLSFRHKTLLNLMSTCRQVREELGELFWIHTEFNFDIHVHYDPLWVEGSAQILQCLNQRFANGIIAEEVRRLTIYFYCNSDAEEREWGNADDDAEPCHLGIDGALSEAERAMKGVIASLPNLTHVTFFVRGAEWFKLFRGPPIFPETLDTLKRSTGLLCVRFQGKIENDTLKYWKSQLGSEITVSASSGDDEDHAFPPVCYSELCTHKYRGYEEDEETISSPNTVWDLSDEEVWNWAVWIEAIDLPDLVEFRPFEVIRPFEDRYADDDDPYIDFAADWPRGDSDFLFGFFAGYSDAELEPHGDNAWSWDQPYED